MADRFNVKEFNVGFEQARDITKAKIREQDKEKLGELNKITYRKKITEMSVGEIMIGVKDTWFDLIDDLLQRKFSFETFTKNNRMFFMGLTIVIIVLVVYIYDVFTRDVQPEINKKTVEVYHMYKNKDANNDSYSLSESERQVAALSDIIDSESI